MLLSKKLRRLVARSKYRLATVNAATYLQQLNLQQLNKTKKPSQGEDPKEFYIKLKEEALKGPIFSEQVIKKVEDITLELNKNEVKWLANILKTSNPNLSDLPLIIEWSRVNNIELKTQSFNDVFSKTKAWQEDASAPKESFGKFKTKDVVFRLPGGYTIVRVTDCDDLKLEGEIVQNCLKDPKWDWCGRVTDGDTNIFSLRDSGNRPEVSIEVLPDGEVEQIKGKQNDKPALEFQKLLLPWLATLEDTTWLVILQRENWEVTSDPYFLDILAPAIKAAKNYLLAYDLAYYLSQTIEGANTLPLQQIVEESKDADLIYEFAKNINGANIPSLQKIVEDLKDAQAAYEFAVNVRGANIPSLQKIIEDSKDVKLAYHFAEDLEHRGANIPPLQKIVENSKNAKLAYFFARRIYNADIPPLQKVVEESKDAELAFYFASSVSGAAVPSLQKVIEDSKSKRLLVSFSKIPGADIESLKKVYEENGYGEWPYSTKKEGKFMKKEIKNRLLAVARTLEVLGGPVDPIHYKYEELQNMLRNLADIVPDDQQVLLIQASQLIQEAEKVAVRSKKK